MYYGIENFLEKKASRAWKRNWGNLSDNAVQRLNSSGVFDNNRELSGLQKSVKNMVERHGGRIYSSPRSRYDVDRFYKTSNGQKVLEKYMDFANQTSVPGGADLVEAKRAAIDYITKEISHDNGAFAMPGAGVYISPKMKSSRLLE